MKKAQRGFTLTGAITGMVVLALVGLFAAKLLPSYIEYFAVEKILKSMENAGELKGSVGDIRKSFNKRNLIENVNAVTGEDLEVAKEGGEVIVTANWSVKVPMVYNFSACLDFSVTTAKK
jgi:type II secretory pathway pseudopilin PulG